MGEGGRGDRQITQSLEGLGEDFGFSPREVGAWKT